MLTANFRSFSLIGLQIGSPSRLTRMAGVSLKKIVGRVRLHPLDVLRDDLAPVDAGQHAVEGDHALLVRERPCRSRSRPPASAPSARVGKLDSVILRSLKLTSRSAVDTLVSASILRLPRAGFVAPLRLVGHRRVGDHVPLVVPARHLRLVDEDRPAARRRVGAWPAAVDREVAAGLGPPRRARGSARARARPWEEPTRLRGGRDRRGGPAGPEDAARSRGAAGASTRQRAVGTATASRPTT